MPRSFYTTRDYVELYNRSNTFSALVTAAPLDYGLTATEASDYAALNASYGSAFLLAEAPETKTVVTIADRNAAAVPLRAMAEHLAYRILGTPTVTEGQKLALGLNVRKTPEPMPVPGTPYAFVVSLDGVGGLSATWKCDNQGVGGVQYNIYRRNSPTDAYQFLASAGQRKLIDDSIPAGSSQITYKIQAARTTGPGLPAEFNVNFGISSSGSMTASVTPVKLAA